MDIVLIPAGNGARFLFPALPEKIQGRYGGRYQSFDIISQGSVKVPKGMDVAEFSWDGVFFGESKRNEPIVSTNSWKKPEECVTVLHNFMKNEAVLNLIVTETWINMDVTISSFQPKLAGAFGNIEYSITLVQKRALEIYTTSEMNIEALTIQARPRNDSGASSNGGAYTVVKGDTLWGIASKKLGGGVNWPRIYDANKEVIETTARKYRKSGSDHGHWIYPGTVLTIPG